MARLSRFGGLRFCFYALLCLRPALLPQYRWSPLLGIAAVEQEDHAECEQALLFDILVHIRITQLEKPRARHIAPVFETGQ